MLVETKTLAKFLYLEHGAHWAIGALAIIMLITTVKGNPGSCYGVGWFVLYCLQLLSLQ